jgi:hypothetical protein
MAPKTPAKKASAKTPAKKTPAKKTPAKKTPAKKTPAKKAPAKKAPAKKSLASAALAAAFEVELPAKIAAFVDQGDRGLRLQPPPAGGFDSSTTLKLRPGAPELLMFHQYAVDVAGGDGRSRLPLAVCGQDDGTYFVAIDLSRGDDGAVHFYDYESGFHQIASSFDAFLASLLRKGDRTPAQKIEATHEQAKALHAKEKNAEAWTLLEPILEAAVALPHLRVLRIAQNPLTDLGPLASCRELEVVECYGCPGVRGAAGLAGIPSLQRVTSHGSLGRAEVEELRRLRPDVEVD